MKTSSDSKIVKCAQAVSRILDEYYNFPNLRLRIGGFPSSAKDHPGVAGRGPTTGAFTNAVRALAEHNMPPWPLSTAVRDTLAAEERNARRFYSQLPASVQKRVDTDAAAKLRTLPNVARIGDVTRAADSIPYAGPGFLAYLGNKDVKGTNPDAAAKAVTKAVNEASKPVQLASKKGSLAKAAAALLAQRKEPEVKAGQVKLRIMSKDGVRKHAFAADIADTPELQRRGLMFRPALEKDAGMLFTKAGEYWMKNVEFPLDLVFLDKAGSILDVVPMSTVKQAGLRLYRCRHGEPASAIELPAGTAAASGITPGDYVEVYR